MLLWKVKKNTFKFAVCAKIQKITRRVIKRNKPPSGFPFFMFLAEKLSSKFRTHPVSFASRAKYSFFGQPLRCGHYQPTYQPPEGVYTLNSGIT